jgi:hypothetical protein
LKDLIFDGFVLNQEHRKDEGRSGVNHLCVNVLFWLEIEANEVFVDVVICGVKDCRAQERNAQ